MSSSGADPDKMDTGTDEKPFRFFNLPRELRNKIYCESVRSIQIPPEQREEPRLEISSFPISGLGMICRQFKREYEEEILRYTTAVCYTYPQDAELLLDVIHDFAANCAGHLQKIKRVELRTHAEYLKPFADLDVLVNGVAALFPALRFLGIDLRMSIYAAERHAWLNRLCDRSWVHEFLALQLHPDSRGVGIEHSLLVRTRLFSMHRVLVGDEKLALSIEMSDENEIWYHATQPEHGEDAWLGMRLSTYEVGTYDYEALLREARELEKSSGRQDD